MSVKINLLPSNFTEKKGTAVIVRGLKTATIATLSIAILSALGVLSFFLINTFELKGLEDRRAATTSQLQTLQESEQKMVLVKDRLSKIKVVKSAPSAQKSLTNIDPVLTLLPTDASIGEVSMDMSKIDATFVFRDSIALSTFLDNLSESKNFSTVTLTSFGFTAQSGYLVGLRFNI